MGVVGVAGTLLAAVGTRPGASLSDVKSRGRCMRGATSLLSNDTGFFLLHGGVFSWLFVVEIQ